jgi:hypothetical protein
MSWNHRVMRQHFDSGEVHYGIREVFYDEDGTVKGWTAEPVDPHGESVDGLRECLQRMLAALDKPVLDEREELAAKHSDEQGGNLRREVVSAGLEEDGLRVGQTINNQEDDR